MQLTREMLAAARKRGLLVQRAYFGSLAHVWNNERRPLCEANLVRGGTRASQVTAGHAKVCRKCAQRLEEMAANGQLS